MHTNIDMDGSLRKRKIRWSNIVTGLCKVKIYSVTVLILPTKRGNFLRLHLDLQISLPWRYMYSSEITFLFLTVGFLKTMFFSPQIKLLLKLDDDRDGKDK